MPTIDSAQQAAKRRMNISLEGVQPCLETSRQTRIMSILASCASIGRS